MASEARVVIGRMGLPAEPSSRGGSVEAPPVPTAGDAAGWTDSQRSALAGVAGEGLRTTLALIGGYGQSLLHLALDDDTRRRCVEGLLAAADSLAELTDRILELAVRDDGTPDLRVRPVAVDWLAGRLERPRAGAGEPGAVRYHATPGLPFVDVDPLWIGHALRILVARVRRRQPTPAGTVTILAHESGEDVVLSIRGEEPAGERPPARQTGRGTARSRPRPVGEGDDELALCREIVEANGGTIWLDDAHGAGAVTLRLPAHPRSVAIGVDAGPAAVVAAR